MNDRYPNKRNRFRRHGKFAKANILDFGLSVCPKCNHFMTRHYYGDPGDPFPDPRKFRPRCWTCEPETEEERTRREAYESTLPKKPTFQDIFEQIAAKHKAAQEKKDD